MSVEIYMPRLGLTMEDGTVLTWLKAEGERVRAGEPLLEIETDKSTVEIEAPSDGVLGTIIGLPGHTYPVGAIIGRLLSEGEVPSSASPAPAEREAEAAPAPQRATPSAPAPGGGRRVAASPAARHLARKLAVDLADATGTGPGGRVVAWNVRAAAQTRAQAAPAGGKRVSPLARRMARELGVTLAAVEGTGRGGRITRRDVERASEQPAPPAEAREAGERIEPVTRAHRIMARRMTESFGSAPHFYLHAEVNCVALAAARQRLASRLDEAHGIHVTYTDLWLKLAAHTLAAHPRLLAQWTDEGLRVTQRVDIGLATDTPHGLIVPVLRDVARLGIIEIARRRAALAEQARAGRLAPADLELATFTLSNLGMYRVDAFEAILNPPQAAILAVGRIADRPAVVDGQVRPVPTANLSLSVDHRVVDGAAAARFLTDLVAAAEDPILALA